jgi:iron(III) transport system ATP-binding protein
LDAALRAETRTAVVDALTNEGTAAVIVTHDPAEAFALGKQVAVLRGGRLVQTADPITVYQMPIDLETARFVGDCVVLPGEAGGEFVTCSLGRLPLQWHANGKVQVMLRPEQIQVSLQSSAQQAIVVATTYFGKQTMVELSQQNEGGSKLLASLASQTVPAIGTKVGISVAGKVVAYPLNQ